MTVTVSVRHRLARRLPVRVEPQRGSHSRVATDPIRSALLVEPRSATWSSEDSRFSGAANPALLVHQGRAGTGFTGRSCGFRGPRLHVSVQRGRRVLRARPLGSPAGRPRRQGQRDHPGKHAPPLRGNPRDPGLRLHRLSRASASQRTPAPPATPSVPPGPGLDSPRSRQPVRSGRGTALPAPGFRCWRPAAAGAGCLCRSWPGLPGRGRHQGADGAGERVRVRSAPSHHRRGGERCVLPGQRVGCVRDGLGLRARPDRRADPRGAVLPARGGAARGDERPHARPRPSPLSRLVVPGMGTYQELKSDVIDKIRST